MDEYIKHVLHSAGFKGIAYSIFGGFVRIFIAHKKDRINFKMLFGGMLAASFVGLVTVEILDFYTEYSRLLGVVTALAGFCYPEVLNLLKNKVMAKLREKHVK